ncbi:hypothetical protein AVEN_168799-1 [Araneus ventricosus]|uniref:Uncharacterized protein n=1 Tax=Araneus ventricosus TaxID=182803 RepID=A0A4Y2K7T1_ARAVE|nr:hypothetical protein AVEN_168799-1 [Araneus ventricosus]
MADCDVVDDAEETKDVLFAGLTSSCGRPRSSSLSSTARELQMFCTMATRGCSNDHNKFCYICGELTMKKQQRNITDFVKKLYFDYFGVKLGDQDKSCVPHIVCCIRVEELKQWLS